ncbi:MULTISPECIES: beta strand repeat-containing protein [Deinococcus]|uniref:DUF11 domain-containing protein n=1 Tax=Deinococcus rufus TaxID=2136097 RepID=A0ABV7ZGT7_9DEIO|nr:DUF11 domain-containing protein [Deinococcus sp. AB2017081]WQE96819.1 DUF11 domain-containing protein [Deinococcus sp. AB2017081]
MRPLVLPQTFRPLLLRLVALVSVCLTWAGAQTNFSARYTNTATNGDIVLIGNVNYHCSLSTAQATSAQISTCNSARTAGNQTATNNGVYMIPVDSDSNAATTNSSSATLSLGSGSSVLFAGLYWSGISTSATNRATVTFATPSGLSTLTAGSTSVIGGNTYQSFANVTALVQAGGSGVYTVGNIASTLGAANWAGWSLVVAYRNAALPTRNLAVFDGFLQASTPATPLDITVSGFLTPSIGTVKSTIGVVAWDGDAGQAEGASATPQGSLRFGPTTAALNTVSNTVNPVNDVFNSSISTTTGTAGAGTNVTAGRTPNFTNTLGMDIDTFTPNTPLPNGSTSAVVRVIGTSGDVINPGVITLATEIFVPNIKDSLTKTVMDVNGGALLPGDVLEYDLTVKNLGNDNAVNTVLTDAIPANTTFVPGSIRFTLINAGPKTDAGGDDPAEYDTATNRVVARLGTGATATTGGTLAPNAETHLIFRVTVNAATTGDTVISNSGTVTYRQQTLGTTVSDTSDSDPVAAGDQPATIRVATPDLTVDKFHTGTFTPGVAGTFTLRISNGGAAPTFGTVTVTDTPPAGLTVQAISGSGWTCVLATRTCTRSDVLAVGASHPDITVTAVAATAGTFANVASVSGGGEGTSATGNNADSDSVQVVALPPAVTLTKRVRNVTTGSAAGTLATARPGETLEYCVSFSNTGGTALDFVVQDTLDPATTAVLDAYGPGLGLQLTVNAATTTLTSAADADAGTLSAQQITLNHGTLTPGTTGSVCFRALIR